jgi:hypothetical protein
VCVCVCVCVCVLNNEPPSEKFVFFLFSRHIKQMSVLEYDSDDSEYIVPCPTAEDH